MNKHLWRKIILVIIFILNIFLIRKDVFLDAYVELNGSDFVDIDVFSKYNDEGSKIFFDGKEIKENLYELNIDSNVNNKIVGTYKVIYKYNFRGKEYVKERTINVVDKESPTIKVANDVVYKYNNDYSKIYFTSKDNYDGDLTKKVSVNYLDNEVILSVSDSSNNEVRVSLPIEEVEVEPLILKLNGSPIYYIETNGTYNEKGVSVFDGDRELKNYDVSVDNQVDLTKEGTYEIKYTVDNHGVKTNIFRIINVYKKLDVPVREKSTSGEKIVYLTFDDGPCAYTEDFLKILDEYNVKATFFVTDQFNGKYLDIIKKEYDKGHRIAVHTNTHKYSIYASPEDYVNDFNTMNEKIENLIGEKTNLFRFPGGSSNTISRSYINGIMKYLANLMEAKGYVYFDWNVDSTDGAGSGTEKIINNVLNGVRKNNESVVLMHDIHKTTLNALPTILSTLKSEGYEFRVLDENSITAHHGINN
ncbi:MAG: polysaccharide deacetylase [Bacilli bacterium]|nr:polysaccharide deacetylase [Bacilli bacterium]